MNTRRRAGLFFTDPYGHAVQRRAVRPTKTAAGCRLPAVLSHLEQQPVHPAVEPDLDFVLPGSAGPIMTLLACTTLSLSQTFTPSSLPISSRASGRARK